MQVELGITYYRDGKETKYRCVVSDTYTSLLSPISTLPTQIVAEADQIIDLTTKRYVKNRWGDLSFASDDEVNEFKRLPLEQLMV